MRGEISFEPAAPSDAEALADIRVEAMRESLERIGRFDPQRARNRFLNGFSPQNTFHVLWRGERVGFYAVKQEPGGLVLDHLYIKSSRQGKGVGAAVLDRVFALADRAGHSVRVVALKESDSNRFYAKHGFVLVEQAEFDNYYVRRAAAP